jgi:hypothetical protein
LGLIHPLGLFEGRWSKLFRFELSTLVKKIRRRLIKVKQPFSFFGGLNRAKQNNLLLFR